MNDHYIIRKKILDIIIQYKLNKRCILTESWLIFDINLCRISNPAITASPSLEATISDSNSPTLLRAASLCYY